MATEHAERTPSAISRIWHNNPLPRGDLEPGIVPGIGISQTQKLKANGVETVDQLVGQFFLVGRDEARFIEYLEDVGIWNQCARECARNMSKKLGGL